MANNNNKDEQNRAGRDSNTQNQAGRSQSQGQSQGRSGAMSPEEAGHLGGTAPHSCRGFECQQQGHSNKDNE